MLLGRGQTLSNGLAVGTELWYTISELKVSDTSAGQFVGVSVHNKGNDMIVGGHGGNGQAYVFTKTGSTWSEQQKLTASDAASGDEFGYAVWIDGDTCIVGADREDGAGTNRGAAYVFTRSGGVWTQQQKLTASDAANNDFFGSCVCVLGDTCLIGAPRQASGGTLRGAVYVFTRSGGVWTQVQKLTASDAADNNLFGDSISIDGTTCVIGCSRNDSLGTDAGAAYVFTESGGVWTQQQKLTASDGAAGDYFGLSVSVSTDTCVVGAPYDGGANEYGSAYVFTRSGGVWTQQQKLTLSSPTTEDHFGFSLCVVGDECMIGRPGPISPISGVGSAYFFTRTGGVWTQQQTLSEGSSGDCFTSWKGVHFSGSYCVIGAYTSDSNAGSIWIFKYAAL